MRFINNNMFLPKTFFLLLFILFWTCYSAVLGQNIYKDLQGRFSLELHDGWKLTSEKFNKVYTFKDNESGAAIIITYLNEAKNREEVFADQVEDFIIGNGYDVPPKGTVIDMTVNECPARWAEYSFEVSTNGTNAKLFAYLGSIVNEDEDGLNFLSIISNTIKDQIGETIKHTFETLRLGDKPLSGIKNVVSVDVDFTKPPVDEKESLSSIFKSELLSLTLPSGWTSNPGSGSIITTIKHEDFGTLTVMGKEEDEFGANREVILNSVLDGIISQIPSMHNVKGPYELTATSGETLIVEELEGNITSEGQSFPYCALLAAEKNENRGLGFLGMYSSQVKNDAKEGMLTIIKSLK